MTPEQVAEIVHAINNHSTVMMIVILGHSIALSLVIAFKRS